MHYILPENLLAQTYFDKQIVLAKGVITLNALSVGNIDAAWNK